jgi:cytidyltransferase-like protein
MKIKRILIVGGCFDILHPGHIDFLEKAHTMCDYLIVLLEPDEKVRTMKGEGRPRMNLESRILNLEKTGLVDEVIALPVLRTNEEYEKEIKRVISSWLLVHGKKILAMNYEPITINFTFGITKKERNIVKNQKIKALGKKLNIEVIEINELLPEWSTSTILSALPRNKYGVNSSRDFKPN